MSTVIGDLSLSRVLMGLGGAYVMDRVMNLATDKVTSVFLFYRPTSLSPMTSGILANGTFVLAHATVGSITGGPVGSIFYGMFATGQCLLSPGGNLLNYDLLAQFLRFSQNAAVMFSLNHLFTASSASSS